MAFLKNLFKKTKAAKSGIVFIVEDNAVYAETLKTFLKGFEGIKEIRIFPVGETCIMELNKNPDLIIMDHYLDSKYTDAGKGMEVIKEIRKTEPELNIVVLSSQQDIDIAIDAVKKYNCSYVKKDNEAFDRLEEIVEELFPA